MFIKPIQGKTVLNPYNNLPLSSEGSEVEDNQFWQRRLDEGVVEKIVQAVESPIPADSDAEIAQEPDTFKKSVKKSKE